MTPDTTTERKATRRPGWTAAVAFVTALAVGSVVGTLAAFGDPVRRANPPIHQAAGEAPMPRLAGLRDIFKRDKSPRQPSPFTADQQAALASISKHFNSFRTMEGHFIQVGPGGEQSEGVFAIAKPGKIRFHYKPPVQLDVVSDGRSVAIRDNRARTQDLYPLSKTPLRYLLSDRIDLTSAAIVSDMRQEDDLISLEIIEKSSLVEGTLTLIFDRQSFELRQWIVTDAQGRSTSVAIFNTITGNTPDPGLFKIYISPKTRHR